MNQEVLNKLKSRAKSFLWRLAGYAFVAALNFLMENIGLFNLSAEMVMVSALLVGEATKFVNVNLKELQNNK